MMRRWLAPSLLLLVVVLFILSLSVGPSAISLPLAMADWWRGGDSTAAIIFADIRLPRALLALMIGAVLGLSGAALQGLLRNPLAEPGLIGVSASAGLGAVIAFYSGASLLFPLALPAGGIAGALIAVTLLYLLAGKQAGMLTLILAGVAISSLASALTSLALSLSPNPFALSEIVFWMLGSLADRSMTHIYVSAPFMLAGSLALLSVGRGLDALSLGEDTARSLGFSTARLALFSIGGTALAVGAAVAVAGAIGFIGLIVPHLLRPLAGYQPSRLLPLSALGGAALLLAADIAVRLGGPGPELKLGVVTALLGAPFFLALVLRHRRNLA
ncbi:MULTISPECIES: iron ABC transporter permease [unclassified Azospirillum]|uniref:FecCD family ABC transporter permease n=1 Tax=unclassified Azospirillum TaxID=2630922 RepID=UPI000B68E5C5|nr:MULTISPECIES: iron ABC transporter permease [unclassified Azospirillum]SNS27795.1 iron complex transport system permease protein [Azospirillum sp. RU38E]SNS46315.1 iron complex transport system permease protein [Azospirillum sp. RU37A]